MKTLRPLRCALLTGLVLASSAAALEITYTHINADGSVVSLPNGIPGPAVLMQGTGVYQLFYPSGPAYIGVPVVTARGPGSNWCKVDSYAINGLTVRCFDTAGQAAASGFTVLAVPPNNDRGIVYAYADSPAAASYSPGLKFNQAGTVTVERIVAGRYRVTFAGLTASDASSVNVVAVGSNNTRCHTDMGTGTLSVNVSCGSPLVDSAFAVAVSLGSAVPRAMGFWRTGGPGASTPYGPITRTVDGPGLFTMVFSGLNLSQFSGNHAAIVTTYENTLNASAKHCVAGEATPGNGPDITIPVRCYWAGAPSSLVDFSMLVLPVELLRNGGFDAPAPNGTTAPAGWTVVDGNPLLQTSGAAAADGKQWVRLNNGGNAVIRQTVATVAGAGYKVSFAFANAAGLPSSSARVKWGGQIIANIVRTATTFNRYTYDVYGLGNTTDLQFESMGSADLLDDVRVTYNPSAPPPPSVTVTTSPAGQPITVDGVPYTAPQTFYWSAGTQHSLAIASPINVNANTRLQFTQWTGPSFTNNNPSVTIAAPASASTYTANLTTQYRLTLAANPAGGGTVTANPAGSEGFHNSGASVQLTAAANTGYMFSSFSALGGAINTPFNPTNLTVSSAMTVTANFTGCTYSINPTSASAPAAGGGGQVTVTAPTGCPWNVTGGSSWLLPGAVNGNTVNYSVAANTGTTPRTASLTIAGIPFSVTQAGTTPCNYTLNTNSANAPAAGGTVNLTVTTGASCAWTADTGNTWILRNGAGSYSGPGAVSYSVAANTGGQRSFGVTVAGRTVTITQAAADNNCTYSISPSGTVTVQATNEAVNFTMTTGAGCQWALPVFPTWIVSLTASNQTGSGPFSLSVAANSGPPRSHVMVVAGQSVTITQLGSPAAQTSGLRFQPLEPCRILETRSDYNFPARTGEFGPPFLNAGSTRTLNPKQYPFCPVPASAKAYVLNVTLIPRPGRIVDYATVWPAGESRPNVYTVRTPDGQIVANSQIIAAGANGAVSVYVSHNADLLLDISGYFTDDPAVSNLVFYPVTPCRAVETRSDYRHVPGQFGPPSMASRQTRSIRFPLSTDCPGIPPAAAYSVTLTVVPPAVLPFLTTWQTGIPQPNVSSINSFVGRTLANNVIVPANALGSIDVFAYEATDFIMDINGYFAADDGVNGQFYFPVTQCRLYDTTAANGPAIPRRSARTISPLTSACAGIGQTARGYAMNVTAVPNGNPMPFITVYPVGSPQPNASVLNAFQGQTVTNFTIVPSGTSGQIHLYAFEQTHAMVEINGYFGR